MWIIFNTQQAALNWQADLDAKYGYPTSLAAHYTPILTPHKPLIAGLSKWAVGFEVLPSSGNWQGLFVPPGDIINELPAGWIDDSMDRLYPVIPI